MSTERSHIEVGDVDGSVTVNLALSRDDLAQLVEGPISLVPEPREDPAAQVATITVDLLRAPAE